MQENNVFVKVPISYPHQMLSIQEHPSGGIMEGMRKLLRTSSASNEAEIMSVMVKEDNLVDRQYPLVRRIFRNKRIVSVSFTYDTGNTINWTVTKQDQ